MDTLHWITKLIRFDTVSCNSNMQLIEAIEAWFKQNGINTYIIPGHSKGVESKFIGNNSCQKWSDSG